MIRANTPFRAGWAALAIGLLGTSACATDSAGPHAGSTPTRTAGTDAPDNPSVSPTRAPCITKADRGPVARDFKVTLLIFSGREDPSWHLTAAQSRELRARILRQPRSARRLSEMDGMLGYYGFYVEAAPSQERFLRKTGLESTFWVYARNRKAKGENLEAFLNATTPCSAFGKAFS